jgi:hypothetical protein
VAEELEPKLVGEVVVFDCTRLDLLLQLRLLPVLLRLQRNRVGSCSGLEFEIAIGGRTGAVVRVAGLAEFELDTGLEIGLDTGMVGLLL